ncbi:hypothetical protein [Plantactinospora sp. GCM10030261]|uniref:hypothetical protein n=1 Tax=Plantactinospora sp. GCM10030261 TaxID=3273420 RepID=UPI003608C52F
MTSALDVSLHDTWAAEPPEWAEFVAGQRLPAIWDWSVIQAVTNARRSPVLAATVRDGQTVRGLVTARFVGARVRSTAIPATGMVDVDCLVSGSLPGIVLDGAAGPELFGETVAALRDTLRRTYGRRVRAVLLRQVSAEALPAVLRWPAIVREGGPIAVFRNRFTSFDDYLAGLSRDRRASLRRVIRRLDADPDLAVSFTGRGDPVEPLDVADLLDLQARTVDRHHRRWYLRRRVSHPAVTRAVLAQPTVHRLTYRDGTGRLLAYGTAWDHAERPILGAWGALGLAEGGRKHQWFHHMAVYLRWCIETGRQGLLSGQASIPEKVQLGHETHRQWAVLVPQGGRPRGR